MTLNFENDFSTAFAISSDQPIILHEERDLGGIIPAPGPFFPQKSNRLLQRDQPFHAHVQWLVKGFLAQLLTPDCKWNLILYLDKYGAGEAVPSQYEVTVAHVQAYENTYEEVIPIPPNVLTIGLYRMAVCLSFEGPNGEQLPPVGFAEIGNLKVYEAA